MKLQAKVIGLVAVFLTACTVGPDYQAPKVDLQKSFTAGGGVGTGRGVGVTTNTVALSGSFLFDLFGGVQRGQEEALANLQASEFSSGDARAANTLAIVTQYLNTLFFQGAAELSRQTANSRRETLRLAKDNFEVGTATDLEIAQVEAELFAAQADVQDYLSGFDRSAFAIATLLDSQPKPILQTLQRGAAQPRAPSTTRLGGPADLVRNLPSIRASEKLYAASVAKLGMAEASLLPSFPLNGNLAIFSTESWSFGPTLSLPVFNQAALAARRDAQIAAAKEAELAWRSSIRSAIESVETNSNSLIRSSRQIGFLQDAVAANERSASLSKEQHTAGLIPFSNLLETQRFVAARKLAPAAEVQAASLDWANLQVSLGRGWHAE